MEKLLNAFVELNQQDQTSQEKTWLHDLHPVTKILVGLFMLIMMLSSFKIFEIIIYGIVIHLLASMSHLDIKKMIKRGVMVLPLSFCLGVSHLFFSRDIIVYYNINVSEGFILFLLILLKTYVSVSILYVVMSITPMRQLSSGLKQLKVPSLLIMQLTMTYQYIFVLLNAAKDMYEAYILRNTNSRYIELKDVGCFIGQLLIRCVYQSQELYNAMICRGFDHTNAYSKSEKITTDQLFIMVMFLSLISLIKVVTP